MRGVSSDSAEVAVLPENDNKALAVQVRQAREQLGEKFRAQAEQLQKLEQDLKELRDGHERLESEAWHQFEALEKSELPSAPVPVDAVLAAVRNLITATLPKEVFNKLTEEACRDRKSTRLNSSHPVLSRMPSSA